MSAACDVGTPLVLVESQSESKRAFLAAAEHLAAVLASRRHAMSRQAAAPQLRFDPARGLVLRVLSEGSEFVLANETIHKLREERAGGLGSQPGSLMFEAVEECQTEAGEPGARLVWSDGGAFIMALDEVKRMAHGQASR